MDLQSRTEKIGGWNESSSDPGELERVTGGVVEFAFGDKDKSYFATSYPHRAEYADKSDVRHMEQ